MTNTPILKGGAFIMAAPWPYLPILDILRSFIGVKGGEEEQVVKQKLEEKLAGFNGNLETYHPVVAGVVVSEG